MIEGACAGFVVTKSSIGMLRFEKLSITAGVSLGADRNLIAIE